jgi:hypothetical protein
MKEKVILELRNSLDKSTIEDAEKMLRSFFRTIEPHSRRKKVEEPERISWEIYAEKDSIGFYVVAPKRLERLIRSRLYDAYPQIAIRNMEQDHVEKFSKPYTAKMDLHHHYMFSTNTNATDTTLNSILNSMSKLDKDERMLLQICLLPINDKWQGKAYKKYRDMLFHGKKPSPRKSLLWTGFTYSIKGLFFPIEQLISLFVDINDNKQKNTPIERAELKGTQKKLSLPAFKTAIRMAVESKDKNAMSTRLSELANSFIETDGDNEWRRVVKINNKVIMDDIINRKVEKYTNNIVTTAELSPIVRMANKEINVPELNKKVMKTLPIPQGLDKGVFLGKGIYNSEEFDIYNSEEHVDSFVHPWMITGAMGGGKTTLINNMLLARALAGYGVILMDTQGDQSRDFLSQLPQSEWHRVVWLNFGDYDYPVAIDMLETVPTQNPRHQRIMMQSAKNDLISLLKKMFGTNFGPQTEYIIRHIITAIMLTGNSSFLDIFRMLVDDNYREELTNKIQYKAPFSWSFWRNFQDNFALPQKMRMMMPSINKIGAFVEDPVIMNLTSQGLGSQNYSFRKMMDEGKIVVVSIPKGRLVGTWQLIGRLILNKIWTAALSRENVDIKQRNPCFLAIDEAKDLVEGSDNLDIMLSQARKFRLGLIYGFQYLNQIKTANRLVYDALIGNKPNIVALKIGEKDAEVYEEIFKGYYNKEEMDFPDLHGIAKLNIKGEYSTPFTLKIPYNFHTRDNQARNDFGGTDWMQENSRKLYAKPIEQVEAIVNEKYMAVLANLENAAEFEEEFSEEGLEITDELLQQLKDMDEGDVA